VTHFKSDVRGALGLHHNYVTDAARAKIQADIKHHLLGRMAGAYKVLVAPMRIPIR